MKTTTRTFKKGFSGTSLKYVLQLILLIIVCNGISYNTYAQTCASTSPFPYEWPSQRNWFFAQNQHDGIIVNMSTSAVTSVGDPFVSMQAYEGNSSVSDDNGNLLFFTNGRKLWRPNGGVGVLVDNNAFREGDEGGQGKGSAAQGCLIVKHPLNYNDYYVFTTDDALSGDIGFHYTVVNKNGTVKTPAARLGTYRTMECVAATKHSNGIDIWITTREGSSGNNGARMYTYLLTCTGLSAPVVSTIPALPYVDGNLERRGMAFSYNGQKLAVGQGGGVLMLNFNNATGNFSNPQTFGAVNAAYDLTFSPDNNRLYVAGQNGFLQYFNVSSGVGATIDGTQTSTGLATGFSSLEIGPGGVLYYSSGAAAGGNLMRVNGNLNTGGAFSSSAVAGTTGKLSMSVPNIFVPPNEYVKIDPQANLCVTDAAVNLSTNFVCLGSTAEDGNNRYSGTGITNAANGTFNPATAGVGTHTITFTRCDATHSITINVTACGCTNPTINTQPVNLTRCVGATANFTVAATGAGATYQWQVNKSGTWANVAAGDGSGGTTNSFTTVATTAAMNSYQYRVIVSTGATCNVTSNAVTLTVNTPVSITTQPTANTTLCPGEAYTISVVAAGSATITYQWKKNGTNITGATSASYNIPSVVAGDAATYTVDVTNSCNTVTSGNAVLTIRTPVSITTQPTASTTLCPGQAYNISVAASGTATLTYQWKKNGTNITGATNASFSIASVVAGDAATYTVDVTNACGTVTSSNAVLVVRTPVSITTQPTANTTLCPGDAYNISVVAAGTATLTYQWKKNGTNITGATSASYSIASVAAGDAATYTVDVTNNCGTVTSSNAVLTIRTPVSITTQPTANTTLCVGQAYNISVVAAGTATLTYQWKKNGTNITGATSASFSIASVAAGDAATYTVDVTNACGTVTSNNAVLTVNALTAITTQPTTPITLCAPAALNLSVVATGAGTLTYQWKKGGTNITGATSANYSIASTATTDGGNYTVDVTGTCGTVTSTVSVVTINGATITTQPTDQTTCASGNATFVSVASGTGLTYQWQLNTGGGFADIAGATSASYTVSGVTGAQNGHLYRVIVRSNGACDQTSTAATLNVNSSTTINNQPVGGNFCVGDALNLSVNAGGAGTVTYQWKKDGVNITGATSANYTITAAALTDAGSYTVDVNSTCGPATSTAAVVNVNGVTITTHPADATVCPGTVINFTAAATGPGLSYQWQVDNGGGFSDIAGATATTYSIPAASVTSAIDGYRYRVVIRSNTFCPANSNAATVTITPSAVITTQPATNTNLCAGQPLNLSIIATGPGTLTYQWNKDGNPVAGATSANFSIASVTVADAGTYTVVVTGSCGPVTSTDAVVNVNGVTINDQPTDQGTCNNGNVTFTVAATGPGLTYQWQLNPSGTGTFSDIPGETNATLTINPVLTSMSGNTYRVNILSNGLCPLTSSVATLLVNSNTSINTQPVGGNYCVGEPLSMTVAGSGTGTPTYQWYLNNTPITNATNATYSVVAIAAADAGTYKVDVTTSCGTVTSNDVVVKVNGVTINTQPTDVHVCQGSNASFTVAATGIGNLTYQWQVGTGGTFTDINGQTSTSYSLTTAMADDNNQYRVLIKDDNECELASDAVNLLIDAVTVITAQPTSTSVCEGAPFMLSVTATTEGTPTYTWAPDTRSVGSNSSYSVAAALPSDAGTYSVTIGNSGLCPSVTSNSVTVTVTPTPLRDLPVTAPDICLNTAGTITVANSQTNVSYQVFNSNDNAVGTSVSGTGNSITLQVPTSEVAAAGVHTFVVKADPGAGCPIVQLDNLGIINVIGAPGAVTGPTSVCTNANTGLIYSVTEVTPISSAVTYNWSIAGGTVNPATIPGTSSYVVDLNPTGTPGTITLVSVSTTTATCPVNDSKTVNQVIDYTNEDLVVSEETICIGNTVTFTVTNPNAVGYNWMTGPGVQDQSLSSKNPKTFRFDTAGDITVSLQPVHPCRTSITPITKIIHVIALPVANAGSDVNLTNLEPIALDGTGSSTGALYQYSWTTSDFGAVIQDPGALTTSSIPSELNSTYTLTVSVVNLPGCSVSDDKVVVIVPSVHVPNVFSPNNDQIHDVLVIKNIQFFPKAVMYIYNQWGELVYKSQEGYPEPWDGTRNGTQCGVSAYYYVLELNKDDYKNLSGSVTIVR